MAQELPMLAHLWGGYHHLDIHRYLESGWNAAKAEEVDQYSIDLLWPLG
jgi:hypothetical protein